MLIDVRQVLPVISAPVVQMPRWLGVVPWARDLLILRTISFRFSRFVPTRRLSAIQA